MVETVARLPIGPSCDRDGVRTACNRGWTIDTRLPSQEYIGDDFTRVCYHQFTEEEIAEIIAGAGLD